MEWRKEEQIFDEEEGRRRIENGFSVLGVYVGFCSPVPMPMGNYMFHTIAVFFFVEKKKTEEKSS